MVSRATNSPKVIIIVMILSLIIAAIVNIYPLGFDIAKFRPMTLMMVVIFWIMSQPRYMGIFATLFVGLCSDILLHTIFGQQAFCLLLATFFLRLSQRHVKHRSFFIEWVTATLSLIILQMSLWIVQFMIQKTVTLEASWSLLSSIVMWPILSTMLYKFRL